MSLVSRDPIRDGDDGSTPLNPFQSASATPQALVAEVPRDEPGAGDVMALDQIANSSVNVLVTASHAGERLAWARRIHERVARRAGPFVAVYPSGRRPIRPTDVEEWMASAAGGTLLIDEVARLSQAAQARLFSLLTEQSRRAVVVPRGVRVVAGSGRSLRADLVTGTFSDALFYRLNVIHIDRMPRDESGACTMKARDIMSKACACAPDSDLATVARLMWDHDCGFMPVVEASGSIVGVVTDRDICIATATRRLLPEHLSAGQVMTTPIRACMTDDSISDVLATLKQFRIRRVPVIDNEGTLQGVISLNDIVRISNERQEPEAAQVVSTMAAICGHRQLEPAVE